MREPFKRNLDLHASEWSKAGKKQPILGVNGLFFCIAAPLIIGFAIFVKWLVTTMLDVFGYPNGLIAAMAICFLVICFALKPIVNGVVDLVYFLLRKTRRQ